MTDLCFVTTCRARLDHLKKALPTLVAQPGTSCVVVDYDCPEHAADWVEANHPEVKVVRVKDRPHFEISRARNLGAEQSDSPWLCFVDADNRLAPGFAESVRPLLQRGSYLRPHPQSIDASGICICHSEDFRAIGGYDAVLQGYGMDDRDFYMRLEMSGVKAASFPGELIEVVPHDVALRVSNYAVKNVRLNATLNQLYCNVKWDLARLKGRPMNEAMRVKLYAQVSEAVHKALSVGQDLTFRVNAAEQRTNVRTELTTTLEYHLRLTQKPAALPDAEPDAGQ